MTTLGIFTVKNLIAHRGDYYTYGGFGDQVISAFSPYFSRILLVAHVAEGPPPEGFYSISRPKLEVVHLPKYRHPIDSVISIPVMYRAALRAVPRMDVVAARVPDYTGIVGALVAKRLEKPLFLQIIADWALQARSVEWHSRHGLGVLLKIHLQIYDLIERVVCRGQLVFAQGDTCFRKHQKDASSCHLAVSSAHHIKDVLDDPKPKFGGNAAHMLNVGRLTSIKNQAIIIEALMMLRSSGLDWHLTLVGDGPSQKDLIDKTELLGVEDLVCFPGLVTHGEELWAFYDQADVFVLSSNSEGTPKVILEAMARGLPVIATKVSGVPSVIRHMENGLLFQPGDVSTLCEHLTLIQRDKELRNRIIQKGIETARKYTVETVTQRTLGIVFNRWPHLQDMHCPTPVR